MVRAASVLCVCTLALLASARPIVAARGEQAMTPAASVERARELVNAGQHADAVTLLTSAARRLARAGDRHILAEAELLRSSALRAVADGPAAQRAAESALSIGRALGDPALQARALTQLARLHADRGEEMRVSDLLRAAASLAERAADPGLTLQIDEARAANARARGDGAAAVAHYGRVIAGADAHGDTGLSIRGRTGRSSALLGLGRFDEALSDADRAYALAAEGPARQRASTTFALAQVHAHLWNLDRAAELWEEAIDLYREAGIQLGVALSFRQSMDTRFALREFDRALADGEAALALYEKTGSQGSLPDTLARLALIEARRGRHESAAIYAARARDASAGVPARRLVFIENDLGLVDLYSDRPSDAARHFRQVRDVARRQGDAEYQWRGLYGLGRAALARGDAPDAQQHLQDALGLLERMRRALPAPAQRATFMAQRSMVHEALVDALFARSSAPDDWYARRAFEVAERARARALADQLVEAQDLLPGTTLAAVRAREVDASRGIAAVQKQLAEATTDEGRRSLEEALEEAEAAYERVVARARRESPRHAALAWPQPIDVTGVLRMLAPDEALIEYLVGEEAGWGWAFAAGRMVTFRLPPRATLERLVREVRAAAIGGHLRELRASGAALRHALLGPAEAVVGRATRLIVVPDGPLHRLPFGVLPSGHGWVVQRHAMSVAPSATVLATIRQRGSSAPRALLAFATPGRAGFEPLPNARAEAVRAARRVAGGSAVIADADEAHVKRPDLGDYRVLHFAAHALVDERVPRRSAIVLGAAGSEDGLLQVNEIAHLPLNADLVVLAACRTQMGHMLRAEGLLGLSRAFLQAGARSVVASLWDVKDTDSRALMDAFYGHLATGSTADAALRLAQLDVMRAADTTTLPAAWGAFVISGDGSRPIAESAFLRGSVTPLVAVALAALFVLVAVAKGARP